MKGLIRNLILPCLILIALPGPSISATIHPFTSEERIFALQPEPVDGFTEILDATRYSFHHLAGAGSPTMDFQVIFQLVLLLVLLKTGNSAKPHHPLDWVCAAMSRMRSTIARKPFER